MDEDRYKGQHLCVSRGVYIHHGLGDGQGGVIHYSGFADGLESGPVCRVPLAAFAGGKVIQVRSYSSRRFSPEESVTRGESRLGENGYSLWGNNCEHFVEWCITGNHDSKQVNRGAAVAGALLTHRAGRGAIAIVASQGTVAGLSASGIMSGLATTGGVVGGGAVAGLGVLGGVGGVGMAPVLNSTVFKDDLTVPAEERKARSVARKATYGGALVSTAAGIVAVSATGTTAGLSAAGITSGLAAVGGLVGGGMAAGVTIVAAAPVAAAAVVGYGAYRLWKWSSHDGGLKSSNQAPMEDISVISGGLQIAKSGWALLEYLRAVAGADIISAYFRHDGTRVEGSDQVQVELHPVEGQPSVWWFSVKPLSDYAFLREPVNPSCAHEIVGQIVGEVSPDSRYWRWVAPTLPDRIYGGAEPPNLKVDFLVFGYRPKALLKYFGEK